MLIDTITKKDLSKYYEMNREYIKQKKSIEEVQYSLSKCKKCDAQNCAQKCELELHLKSLTKLMELTALVCDYEKKQLQRYIDTIPDCRMHHILSFRYIKGLSWNQVAASIDNELTGKSIKKTHDRFVSQRT